MGWSFIQGATKADIVARSRAGQSYGGVRIPPVASSLVGNHLWQVEQLPDGRRFIVLYLLGSEKGYGWGYKDLAESSYPYYFDVPLSFLKMAPVANEKWREAVRESHAKKGEAKSKKAALRPGMRLRLPEGWNPREVTVVEHGGKLYGSAGGQVYSLPPKVMKAAEVLPSGSAARRGQASKRVCRSTKGRFKKC